MSCQESVGRATTTLEKWCSLAEVDELGIAPIAPKIDVHDVLILHGDLHGHSRQKINY
jgi:hypothetical protein